MSLLIGLAKLILYFILPLGFIASLTPVSRYYLWSTIYVICLAIAGTWGFLASIPMYFAGAKYNVNWLVARSFYNIAGPVIDWTVEVEDEEHLLTRPAIIVGNHQSMVDILFLGRFFPKQSSIMAKKEVRFIPMLGPFMSMSGCVFVDRGNSAKAQKSLKEASEAMKARGTSLFVFPEGTRHNSEQTSLLPFKKGAFYLAVQVGIPIIPVVVENYWKHYHLGLFRRGAKVKVKVLPPIPTEGLQASDVGALSERVREQMLETLLILSGETPVEKPKTETTVREEKPALEPSAPPQTSLKESASGTISPPSTTHVAASESSENGTDVDDDMVIVPKIN